MKNINKEDILEVVKMGVKDAFLTAMESGDGYTGAIIKEEILTPLNLNNTYGSIHDIDIADLMSGY